MTTNFMAWMLKKTSQILMIEKSSKHKAPKGMLCLEKQLAKMKEYKDLKDEDWYFSEWVCKDYMLRAKSRSLIKHALKVFEALKLDTKCYFVTFKNVKPHKGNTYNIIDIRDEKGFIRYTIIPRTGYREFYSIGQISQAYLPNGKYLAAENMKELCKLLATV